jgi:hypothetical protein
VNLLPIHKARVGRLVLAALDEDENKAADVVGEAINDDTLPELLDVVTFALVGFLRRVAGDDGAKQWASDWVLHAHNETSARSTDLKGNNE